MRIEKTKNTSAEYLDQTDFPEFVSELLEGVFEANLRQTLKQMESYQELLKAATEIVADFIDAIEDEGAFNYLAENNDNDFNIDFNDPAKTENAKDCGAGNGNDSDEVNMRVVKAKLAIAKEQRTLLRETILMGITRLSVKKS